MTFKQWLNDWLSPCALSAAEIREQNLVDISESMIERALDPKAARLRELDDKILEAVKAYNKAQLYLFALRAERELVEEELS